MDGFDSKKGVIIIVTTNRPEIIDPALLRPGRFDRVIVVDRPDLKGRREILKLHCQNIQLGPDVDLEVIVAITSGMVGADLANIVNEVALLAARKGKNQVEMEDFEEAIDKIIAGLAKRNRYLSPEEKKRIAYHEAGHTVVALVLTPQEKVHRISILLRGGSALGYTLQLPTEERYPLTKSELLAKITVLLGGRTAEELIFKEVSNGAQNDLERATEIARAMVLDDSMSETFGSQTFRKREHIFLDVPFKERELFSEKVASQIDDEIGMILKSCYENALSILKYNLETLEKIVLVLMEKKIIEGEELEKLLYKKEENTYEKAI